MSSTMTEQAVVAAQRRVLQREREGERAVPVRPRPHGIRCVRQIAQKPLCERVRQRRDDVKLSCVLSNSFGFGGTNASVVFKRLDA